MIIEIEYYKGDVKISGARVSLKELERALNVANNTYSVEKDDFEVVLCKLLNWKIVQTDEKVDYVYDRDIEKLYKPYK
ncbi:MAG: hypothetical protein K6G88_09040 [Lachnospiraceae bacterium]|jgi:hypothetical protein|nr:hypothetical protein [Lachnospiraceae bacterium]